MGSLKPIKALRSFVQLPNEIKFYNRYEKYYEFTNFYQVFVKIDDLLWPSSEHYFQAQKFVGTPFVEKIRKMSSARETFQCSRNPAVSRWQRSDWDQVKDDIMLKALRCKFKQCEELSSLLVGTGDKKLIEHTENDSYWGDGGGEGKGLNKLGQLLMKVRGELRQLDVDNASVSKASSSRLKRRNSFSLSGTNKSKLKYTDDMNLHSETLKSTPLRRYGSHNSLVSSPSLARKSLSGVTSSLRVSSPSLACKSPNSSSGIKYPFYSKRITSPCTIALLHQTLPKSGNDSHLVYSCLHHTDV